MVDYGYEMKGTGVGGEEVAKTAAGGAAGAIIGRTVGGKKGTIAGALGGAAAGAAVGLWLSRYVAPLLYGLEPGDPVTLIAAVSVLGAVAAVAMWIPASRATRTDPAQVLRES